MADRLLQRVTRAAGFLRRSGLLEELQFQAAPGALPHIVRGGLSLRNIHEVQAVRIPNRLAFVDDDRFLTYATLNALINRSCRALEAAGVQPRDRVVLCMENRVEYAALWFALLRARVAAVHASYRSTPEELAYVLAHSGAKAIFSSAMSKDAVAEVCQERPDMVWVDVDAPGGLDRWAESHSPAPFRTTVEARGDNVVYTSGTTGKPKGAVRDFASGGITELSRVLERLPMRAADRHLLVAPMYHSAAQAFTGIMTSLGGTLYVRKHFDAHDALASLSRWRIHSVFMVPTMIRRMLDLPPEVHSRHPTPELRVLISGAASFPDALRRRAVERFGPDALFDFYGATELGWITLADGHEMLARPGTVGRALSGHELSVFDADGNALAAGEVGTIWVRSEQTMEGYLDDDRSTDDVTRQGWITCDDLGYLDSDGYLFLSGRDRDMVISGGVNLYPVEIEEVLAHHAGVDEVAVIGLPDDEWGERLVAVYVGSATATSLTRYAREHLARNKVPKEWHRIEQLPRNPTGKVLKRELRERFG